MLFHEIYSVYAEAMADALLCNKIPAVSEQDGKAIRQLAESVGLLEADGKPRFVEKNGKKKSYFGDILPLSKMECEWLYAILGDSFAEVFFNKTECGILRQILKTGAPFPIRPVFSDGDRECPYCLYHDRYHSDVEHREEQTEFLSEAYQALRKNRRIEVVFFSGRQRSLVANMRLSALEYSLRDNVFRLCGFDETSQAYTEMRVDQIVSVCMDENGVYDRERTQAEVKTYIGERMCYLQFVFTDIHNLPDRILTEFSLWKKLCVYYRSGTYLMTLVYPEADEKEILIRILSYGADLKVTKPEGDVRLFDRLCRPGEYIYHELEQRTRMQESLFEVGEEKGLDF